jgi:hypothetical protein
VSGVGLEINPPGASIMEVRYRILCLKERSILPLICLKPSIVQCQVIDLWYLLIVTKTHPLSLISANNGVRQAHLNHPVLWLV